MHIDTPVFFLLVLVAMLFRWLTSAANKAAKKSNEETRRSTSAPRTNAPVPGRHEDTDEDRIRKFLEALGQPPGSPPPPVVKPRTEVPPRPVAPIKPPPSVFSIPQGRVARKVPPQEIYRERPSIPPAPVRAVSEVPEEIAPASEPSRVVATPVEVYVAVREEKITAEQKEVIALLKSPVGLRQAIILREIFGPPRSLQPFDLVGSA